MTVKEPVSPEAKPPSAATAAETPQRPSADDNVEEHIHDQDSNLADSNDDDNNNMKDDGTVQAMNANANERAQDVPMSAQDPLLAYTANNNNNNPDVGVIMAQDPPAPSVTAAVAPVAVLGAATGTNIENDDDDDNWEAPVAAKPSYQYPNMNYYPTFPANVPSLARYDSDVFGTGTSESDDDGESGEEADEEGSDAALLEGSVHLEEEEEPHRSYEGKEPPENHLAASAPSLLQNLPQTYRPFAGDRSEHCLDSSGNSFASDKQDNSHVSEKQPAVDYSYISTQSFHGDEYESYSAIGASSLASKRSSYTATKEAVKSSEKEDAIQSSKKLGGTQHHTDYSYNSSTRPLFTRPLFTGDAYESYSPIGANSSSGRNTHKIHTPKGSATKSSSSTVQKVSRKTYNSLPPIPLHTLPIDALHATSTYCTPVDWAAMSSCSNIWRGIGKEVFSKVWRHAGKCVVEVGVAWARGEHADARELASLYISKGVPIYPTPHGHSYHTVAWRMGLELDSLNPPENSGENNNGNQGPIMGNVAAGQRGGNAHQNQQGAGGNANNAGGNNANAATTGGNANNEDDQNYNSSATDVFYTERYVEARAEQHRDSLFSRNHMTYVEEKAVFWKQKNGIEIEVPPPQSRGGLFPRRFSFNSNLARAPPPPPPPPPAAPQAGFGGLVGLGGPAGQYAFPGPDAGLPHPPNDWPEPALTRVGAAAGAAGGIGLARPPPLPSAVQGMAATMPVAGLGPIGARPQSAVPGPRPPLPANVDAAASANAAAAASFNAVPNGGTPSRPRYVRRSSFSGAPSGSLLSTSRNTSSPNLVNLVASQHASAAGVTTAPPSNNMSSGQGDRHTLPSAPTAPKMTMKIHRHLADQHLFGGPAINDENGNMSAGKMSMSADFFHPTWEGRRNVTAPGFNGVNSMNNRIENWDGYWDGQGWRTSTIDADANRHTIATSAPTTTPTTAAAGAGVAAAAGAIDTGVAAAANAGTANWTVNEDGAIDISETVDREGEEETNNNVDPNRRMMDNNYRAAVRAFVSWTLANADRQRRNSLPTSAGGTRHPLSLALNPSLWSQAQASSNPATSPASDVHLELYSSSSASLKSDDDEDNKTSEAVAKMRSRCTHYQSRLDSLLTSTSKFDTTNFQEVLLDFWDELFPTTCGVHFYNQQSPVPRMSKLHTFLTTPCPKAIGTIQCEIERVKISGKNSKGAKRVKGRFFPSYEYRLFIRDTKNDNPYQSSASRGRYPPRKDSVLLVAKNKSKGRNSNATGGGTGRGSGVGGIDFATPAALASPSSGTGGSSKRGVTNYYMCLPQQKDVDSHFKSANKNNANATLAAGETSGLAVSPLAMQSKHSPFEVGRLQSNFIGTEFQIFVPTKSPRDTQSEDQRSTNASEDGGSQGDSRVHPVDTAVPAAAITTAAGNNTSRKSSRRGSGLVRLARRASGHLSRKNSTSRNSDAVNEPVEESDTSRHGSKKALRRMSWGSTNNINKRTSRRAIANNSESFDGDLFNATSSLAQPNAAMGEVENGAITYTANLLGNRPRIMDVCIPKLMEDGRVSDEWSGERHENVTAAINNGSLTTMLDQFKTIQQGLQNTGDGAAPGNNNNNNDMVSNNNGDDHELMVLQNRPPWWNIELGAFVLNFGGRVKVASVKNFQLCERNDQDHIMQFGRIEGRHAFTMDFQHPLTPMQAFAIAISSLQSKISFG